MKKIIIALAAVAGIVVALSSCCQSVDIAGEWSVTEVDGNALPDLWEGQKAPFLSFDPAENRMHGNTGVNIINSTYTLDGKNLEIGQAMSTMMAGPDEWMKTEREMIDALGTVKTVKAVSSEKIELRDDSGKAVLTLVRK